MSAKVLCFAAQSALVVIKPTVEYIRPKARSSFELFSYLKPIDRFRSMYSSMAELRSIIPAIENLTPSEVHQ